MTTRELTEKEIDSRYDDFVCAIIPFGSSDIRSCVKTALEVDLSMNELADIMNEFCNDTGINMFDDKNGGLDINYVLYDYILQQARNDIETLTDLDIQNDICIETYGNYMCTSFDWKEEDKQQLIDILNEKHITKKDTGIYTDYLLEQMDIVLKDDSES